MTLKALEAAVRSHHGEFTCKQIQGKKRKTVKFSHVISHPDDQADIPDLGKLQSFYRTFGSILLYHDAQSGDAGKYLAQVIEWPDLRDAFIGWIDDLDDEEVGDILPAWTHTCLVIGETPRSGNYLIVPTEGEESGRIFEFDHDGFEFSEMAADIVSYVRKMLRPTNSMLTDMASHMRFRRGEGRVQWWIKEMRDNTGHIARTEV